jgi:hypothetical protein
VGEKKNAYRISLGKSSRRWLLGRQRRIEEGNIQMDLKRFAYDDGRWMVLVLNHVHWQASLVLAMLNQRVILSARLVMK